MKIKFSIRAKLIMGVAFIHTLLVVFVAFDLIKRQKVFLREQAFEEAAYISRNLAANSKPWILTNDYVGLQEIVAFQKPFANLEFAMIIGENGQVLAHTDTAKIGMYINNPESSELKSDSMELVNFLSGHDTINSIAPIITLKNKLIGHVWINLSQENTLLYIDKVVRNSFWYALIAIILGIGTAWFLATPFVAKLQILVKTIKNITDGHRNVRVNIKSSDEIGMLAESFNLMLGTVESKENQLQKAKEETEQLARVKADFLANMSHEIRTPMNAIIGLSQLALDESMSPKAHGYLENIYVSSETLLQLLNNILDFSKIEANRMEIESSPFDLRVTLKNIENLFAFGFEKKRIGFGILLPDYIPHNLIGDELRIQQLLMNLLSNALKFTQEGQVLLTISLLSQDRFAVKLRFSVEDTGIGMAEKDIVGLGSAFMQVDSSITRKFGGTGLGLAISRNLLALMNSELRIKSTQGKGSTFTFDLDFGCFIERKNEPQALDFKMSENSQKKDVKSKKLSFPNARVLVAEDDPINREVTGAFLAAIDVQYEFVDNGLKAIESVFNGNFDLVLMDLHMPVMGGLDATKKIRERVSLNKLPIIALTAATSSKDREMALEFGMNDFISKPVRREEIWAIISRWLKLV